MQGRRRQWELTLADGAVLTLRTTLDSDELQGGWSALDEAVAFLTRTRTPPTSRDQPPPSAADAPLPGAPLPDAPFPAGDSALPAGVASPSGDQSPPSSVPAGAASSFGDTPFASTPDPALRLSEPLSTVTPTDYLQDFAATPTSGSPVTAQAPTSGAP